MKRILPLILVVLLMLSVMTSCELATGNGKPQAPGGSTTASPRDDTTASPRDDSTTSPSDDSTTSPSDDSTTSPSDDSTTSPSDDSTTSPSGGTTTSPSGGTTASPSGGTTASPSGGTTTPPTDPETPDAFAELLADAADELDTYYKAANGSVTSEDWVVVEQILVGLHVFHVSWSVDNAAIAIRDNAAGNGKLIDLPDENDTELTYTLSAVIDDGAGHTKTVTYTRVLPVLQSAPEPPDGGVDAPDTLMTNDGKGLPVGTNGVYDVSFADAVYVKDVTGQSYYAGGCPTTGSPAVLVIPVDFIDCDAEAHGYDTDVIKQAFEEGGVTDYHSVYDYYYTSSYEQLTLDITVLDFWFTPRYTSGYYESATAYYYGTEYDAGDQMILDEALAYLDTTMGMDLSKFDSDGNGTIDAVVLINSLDVGEDNFHWAYRYWNFYTDGNDNYYQYDGVYANDYLWASYQFLHESYDGNGNVRYDDTSVLNTYTYIHEFGHVLGADDYYDTAYIGSPMGGLDVMDAKAGDHNAYTKFNLGWIDTARLVTTDSSVTLTLADFSQSGDTIILANNWDPELGAYQEYFILVYYRNTGLNAGNGGYFARDGILVYHVNASLYFEEQNGDVYYDVYYNNTDPSDPGGTGENLIEFVKHLDGEEEIYTYVVGDSLPAVTDDSGNALGYTFTVDSLEDGAATLTFTKLAA